MTGAQAAKAQKASNVSMRETRSLVGVDITRSPLLERRRGPMLPFRAP